ncbi:MAG: DNA-directed DNA polymerase I [Candidatus Heimdallarchaeota archaeon]|nr:DNA-directed DNA polymerase I [Candidatus Heimdallarchaeota archaeon]
MSKKQPSLDSFFPSKKEEAPKPSQVQKAEKRKVSKKVPKQSEATNQTTSSSKKDSPSEDAFIDEENHFTEKQASENGQESELIFEGAPVEHCPKNTPPCVLLQSVYDGKSGKAFLYLLDEKANRLYGWYDNTGHEPYLLTDLTEEQLKGITPVKKFSKITGYHPIHLWNLLLDKEVEMTKVTVTDPLAIAGGFDSLRDKLPAAWEANIRYHQNYLYDRELYPGMYYQIKNGNLIKAFPTIDAKVREEVSALFKDAPTDVQELISVYLPLLLTRIPHIKRAAMDIEVYTKSMTHISDPTKAEERVIAVSFAGNDGLKKVLVLKRKDVPLGTRSDSMDKDVEVVFFENEAELLRETFRLMQSYPMIITFNGDNYDLPYLYNRANRLKIPRQENPIIVIRDTCRIRNSLHFDAYRFFNQAAIRIYAFGAKYSESSLDAVSSALLHENKIELGDEIGFLDCYTLAEYNFWDSKITLELTTFNDSVTMRLIILLMRLTGMTLEDITRQAVSSWIRNWLFFEHRRRHYLIPRPEEIIKSKGGSTTDAMIKGKKYKGAIVVKPIPGVHFKVTVLDFASLYPSIIKVWNLSYETMNCAHPSCKGKRPIPDTPHWVCVKNHGLMSILVGFIRDIRVLWFKPKAKDKMLDKNTRDFYNVIQSALKVVINASYGVFGAAHFPFYCPPLAEATTAIGRQAITRTIEKCNEMGVQVIYGDTDSVFLKNPTKEQINTLINWSEKELQIDLDIDKTYRYLALSERKKNYLGVFMDGKVDVKGLLGKKRNTPPFLKELFNQIVEILSEVETEEDIVPARSNIENVVKEVYTKLKNRELPVEAFAIRVQLNKGLDQYVKTTPQHVKAARLLEKRLNKKLGAGDLISFVKTIGNESVLPVELASTAEIDTDKYLAQMESTLTQILDPIGVSFDKIIGIRSLDDFF